MFEEEWLTNALESTAAVAVDVRYAANVPTAFAGWCSEVDVVEVQACVLGPA